MKKNILLMAMLLLSAMVYGQHTFTASVYDAKTNQAIPGVTVLLNNKVSGSSDSTGSIKIANLSEGKFVIQLKLIGYQTLTDSILIPFTQSPGRFLLVVDEEGEDLDEVTVAATRTSRTIAKTPTRVEAISGEELDEKANMKPGDIRMVLSESTGVQTQQTSATSGNSSIRIQGLDGKYTQLIRDGFPLYSGFSGGLGLLQVAPLDLKQIEIIKGSSSTLYGGGAIAGLVNLVSKVPTDKRQFNLLLNGTSALGLDASGFYAEKFKKMGTTIFASYNHGSAYAPGNAEFTAIPKFDRFTLNPKLFFYLGEGTTLSTGLNGTIETRTGGDVHYVKNENLAGHTYFEENKTGRYALQSAFDHQFNAKEKITLKNSLSYYDRKINMQNYQFSGIQFSSFSEATYTKEGDMGDWVAGINYVTDKFTEDQRSNFPLRNYNQQTLGGFIQNNWDISSGFTLETGLRGDYHSEYGFLWLPRLSMLWKINDHLTTRLGGGLGYKAPNVFTEDAERIQFRNVLPLVAANNKAERSYGANFDIDYKTSLFNGEGLFTVNQLFFYTRINDPVLLVAIPGNNLQYLQPDGDLNTKGLETNFKLVYKDFKLFVGYTYADVTQHTNSTVNSYPLVSKHRLNNVLMYELEEQWKIGLEAYYFSRQRLNDNAIGKSYWTTGFMVEHLWKRFSVFINFENFTNTRQTKFDTIYNGTISQPVFRDIYAPVDGFVINGGIKIKL